MADLNISSLDFTSIKNNFIDFLSAQTEFSDYDFDGSAFNVLLDVLSYNTYHNSYYMNMITNEMFLDSSTTREATVSIAKQLGYIPSSITAPRCKINLTLTLDTQTLSTFVIPKNTRFSATRENVSYEFLTSDSYSSKVYTDVGSSRIFNFTDIELIEGTNFEYNYIVNINDNSQRFLIPSDNVDTSTLEVKIAESYINPTNLFTYTKVEDYISLTSESLVYFLQEVEQEKYEVYFGDGILGKQLANGNLINLSYIVTNGETSNNISENFILAEMITFENHSTGTASVTVVSPSSGGTSAAETIDSIKFKAPKIYETQERAVVSSDYKSIIQSQVANIEAVKVWGGEDNVPAYYGKVFLAIKPTTGLTLSDSIKDNIVNDILKKYKTVTITPEIVDPDYTSIGITSDVYYNENLATLSSAVMVDIIEKAIINYGKITLTDFDSNFKFSTFAAVIDNAESSIVNNNTVISLRKEIFPSFSSKKETFTVKYYNAIQPGSLSCSKFKILGQTNYYTLADDFSGKVLLNEIDGSTITTINSDFGTISYAAGIISLGSLIITESSDIDSIIFSVLPSGSDVNAINEQLLLVEEENIAITLIKAT
jgi:hypothetical protein